jgi:hypothetical protein
MECIGVSFVKFDGPGAIEKVCIEYGFMLFSLVSEVAVLFFMGGGARDILSLVYPDLCDERA